MEQDAYPNSAAEMEAAIPEFTMPMSQSMSLWQTVTWIAGGLLTTLGTWGAIILRRRRPKSGAEDAVFEINRATIVDLRAQVEILQKENDALRTARAEFEGLNLRIRANLEIASQAAEAAQRAARDSTEEMLKLRERWVKAKHYIFTLRSLLAEHGIAIPPDVTADPPEVQKP